MNYKDMFMQYVSYPFVTVSSSSSTTTAAAAAAA